MDPFLGILALLAIGWAAGRALDHGREVRSESREQRIQAAEKKSGAPLKPAQRRSVAAQHDIGWWSSELAHGAPVHRTGFHAGWLAHKAAAVQARHRREEARTTHAEVSASFGQAIREHKARRATALAEAKGQVSDPAAGRHAVRQEPENVLPFPSRATAPAPAMGPYAPPPNPAWWEKAVAGTCSHGGHGYDGETCDDAPAEDLKPDHQSNGRNDMPAISAPAETTYDQEIRMADEEIRDCDNELARLRTRQMGSRIEQLAALAVDPANLSHLADADAAVRRQIQDVQAQLDSVQAFRSGLIRTHGLGAEYHHSAPNGGASREFLAE